MGDKGAINYSLHFCLCKDYLGFAAQQSFELGYSKWVAFFGVKLVCVRDSMSH